VAHALDIKLGTVRSRIHRGRAMLRESLADRAPTRGKDARAPKKPLLSLPRIAGAR
jgi:RNA polymerase sigma-70 factor (ECF subfamily)